MTRNIQGVSSFGAIFILSLFAQIHKIEGCGTAAKPTLVELRGSTKTVTTPLYPNNYPVNLYCHWLVDAASDHVSYTFSADFDLGLDSSGSCNSGTYVQMYDGNSTNAGDVISKLCGKVKPSNADDKSTQRYLTILFVSDSVMANKGFSLKLVKEESGLNAVAVAGIVIGLFILAIVFGVVVMYFCLRR